MKLLVLAALAALFTLSHALDIPEWEGITECGATNGNYRAVQSNSTKEYNNTCCTLVQEFKVADGNISTTIHDTLFYKCEDSKGGLRCMHADSLCENDIFTIIALCLAALAVIFCFIATSSTFERKSERKCLFNIASIFAVVTLPLAAIVVHTMNEDLDERGDYDLQWWSNVAIGVGIFVILVTDYEKYE